jgi:hypothetical protein
VWLASRKAWRARYEGWPALKKLEYVDELMREVARSPREVHSRNRPESIGKLYKTLGQHYAERRDLYRAPFPSTYDRDLKQIFPGSRRLRGRAASSFLRRNRRDLVEMVARWSGHYQVAIDAVLSDMIGRCRELKLHAGGSERRLKADFAVLLTVRTMRYLYDQGRRTWIVL